MQNRQHSIKLPPNNHQTPQPMAALTATLLPIAQVRATDARTQIVVFLAHVNAENDVIVDMDCHDRPAMGAEAKESQSSPDGGR